ncbi:MAG: hypothetical protein K8T26_11665 [Lentisphaerae bacterium]|nr:hypothetical protein [Lentisphaerota bacterium]
MPDVMPRQIHLDFHTSELIPDIGAKFSRKQWQQALKLGRVQTINIFAKCHHGWSYYPTTVGNPHPNLRVPDLMGAQIEACHEIGVVCPLYFTVGWSVHDQVTHPEWAVRDRQGNTVVTGGGKADALAKPGETRPFGCWTFLCPSGEYLKLMLAQTVEICERYPQADGLWYDITNGPWNPEGPVCYCETCQRGMHAEGIALDDTLAVAEFAVRKWKHFYAESRKIVEARLPGNPIVFFNGTTFTNGQNRRRMWEHNTQQDLEDLPTTWGGYNKFPLRARFFARTAQKYIAMSGKFHTSWGEFGGFKHPDAMRFEAAAMIAFGARCNFGDQLHPSGEMDLATYKNVGEAFRYVQQIEGFGLDGRSRASLGLWWGNDTATSSGQFAMEPNHQGVSEMLLENQIDFEVVDEGDDLSRFAAIILAGAACLGEAQVKALDAYRRQGGKLLVLGEAGLDAATRSRFVLDVGATYVGPANFRQDYLLVRGKLAKHLVASPFVNHGSGIRARLTKATGLAAIREPYFDRTYGAYSSHMNTPFQLQDAPHPGAWALKDLVYLAHPVGYLYTTEGARLHREYFLNALRLVYPAQKQVLLAAPLPSGARVALVHQPAQKRYCAHLLYGPPTPRGRCQIIEDLVPLYDTPVTLRVPETIKVVRLPLSKKRLKAARRGRAVSVTVPRFACHEVVVFEY